MACTGVPGEGAAELKVMSLVAVAGESSQDWGVPAFMCSGAARGQRAWGPGQQGREETDASLQLRESLWTMGKTWDVMPSGQPAGSGGDLTCLTEGSLWLLGGEAIEARGQSMGTGWGSCRWTLREAWGRGRINVWRVGPLNLAETASVCRAQCPCLFVNNLPMVS